MVCGSGCFCCSCYVFVPFYFEYLCTTICTNVLCTRDVSCCIVEERVVPMQEGNCVWWTFDPNWSKSRSNVHRLTVYFFFSLLLNFILFFLLCGVLVPICLYGILPFKFWNANLNSWGCSGHYQVLIIIIIFTSLRWSPSMWQSYRWKDSKGGWETQSPASRSLSTSAPVWTLNNPSQLTSSVTTVFLPEVKEVQHACLERHPLPDLHTGDESDRANKLPYFSKSPDDSRPRRHGFLQ